jgi:hypothetical protein
MTDTPTPPPPPAEPAGFGGWLLLPAFFTVIAPWFFFQGSATVFAALTGPHMANAPAALAAFVWIEGAANVALLAAWIYAIVLLLTRRASFPRVFGVLSIVSSVYVLADILVNSAAFGAALTADGGVNIVRQVIFYLAWIPYMAQSVRVRNTFVR